MKPSEILNQHRQEIRDIVKQNHATNPRVFGSVLSHQDTEESDLDILIDPLQKTTLFDIARIQYKLCDLLKIKVDVLTPSSLPKKSRPDILKEAAII